MVLRLLGQASTGPSFVLDQSIARIIAPPPANNSFAGGLTEATAYRGPIAFVLGHPWRWLVENQPIHPKLLYCVGKLREVDRVSQCSCWLRSCSCYPDPSLPWMRSRSRPAAPSCSHSREWREEPPARPSWVGSNPTGQPRGVAWCRGPRNPALKEVIERRRGSFTIRGVPSGRYAVRAWHQTSLEPARRKSR
jgi:hypothetical protein